MSSHLREDHSLHVSSLFKGTCEDGQDLADAVVNGEECWERVSVKVEVKE